MWRNAKRPVRIALAVLAVPAACALACLVGFAILDAAFPFPAEEVAAVLAKTPPAGADFGGGPENWRMDEDQTWRLPVALDAVSPHLIQATIAVEDKRFHSHAGVDPAAVARAAVQNLVQGRHVSDASTITMQTVRLLWPQPRTMAAKLNEAFRAMQMERAIGKEAILELYFNLVPYGGNIVGAEAAAYRYFGKSVRHLSLGEAALLAGLPRSPEDFDPRRHPLAARQRRWQVLDRMLDDGYVDLLRATRAGKEQVRLLGIRSEEEISRFSRILASAPVYSEVVAESLPSVAAHPIPVSYSPTR